MSRGLTRDQASKMIVEGFLNEVIETITEDNIKLLILKLFVERINMVEL
jgi:Fe-S cluster assembly scaffold protein SufB